jgi:serine phosphatase RsbU (regulator of sigma subunit)
MTVERGLETYRLAKENERFRKELIRRERLARELEIAREIQRYILPSRCPDLENYEMTVKYQPAREVGGDFYDFEVKSDELQIVVGDVSGKSIPAALYGAVFSGQLQTLFPSRLSPAEKLKTLNTSLIARYPSGSYVAVAYCRIDLRNGSAVLANGGMPFPFLVRAGKILHIEASGAPLGLLEGSRYDEVEFQIEPGDTLLFASDGMTDALNPEGDFYDALRFIDSACRHAEKELPDFVESLHSELCSFKGNAELNDDIAIVALRRKR